MKISKHKTNMKTKLNFGSHQTILASSALDSPSIKGKTL